MLPQESGCSERNLTLLGVLAAQTQVNILLGATRQGMDPQPTYRNLGWEVDPLMEVRQWTERHWRLQRRDTPVTLNWSRHRRPGNYLIFPIRGTGHLVGMGGAMFYSFLVSLLTGAIWERPLIRASLALEHWSALVPSHRLRLDPHGAWPEQSALCSGAPGSLGSWVVFAVVCFAPQVEPGMPVVLTGLTPFHCRIRKPVLLMVMWTARGTMCTRLYLGSIPDWPELNECELYSSAT